MEAIQRAWRGQEKLWKVFWLYGLLAQFLIGIALGLATKISQPLIVVISVFYIIFSLWWLVAQWRCAFNVKWKGWGYLARIVCVLSVLVLAADLLGATRSQDSDGAPYPPAVTHSTPAANGAR